MRRLFLITSFISFTACILSAQHNELDSLQNLLQKSKGETRIKILHSLIIKIWVMDPDSAKRLANEAIQLSDQLGNVRLRSISNRLKGGSFSYLSQYDSGRFYAEKALELAIKSGDSTLIPSVLNNIGLTYLFSGGYPEAFEFLLRGYDLRMKIHQVYGTGNNLNNLGLVYLKVDDYKNARHFFEEAIKVADREKDANPKLYAYNNLGASYLQEGDYSKAKQFFLQSLALTVNNNLWKAVAYDGLAQSLTKMKAAAEARKNFAMALSIRNKIGDRKGVSETYYHLSQMQTPARLDSAFFFINASQRLANRLQATDRLLENYAHYKILFQLKRQYDSALHYQSLYDSLKEKQFAENSLRSFAGIKIKMEEEASLRELTVKNALLTQKTYEVKLFIVITVLLLLSSGIIFWFYNTQRKLGRRLAVTNEKIVKQRDEIAIKNEELNNLNVEKNNLIGIVAHDLKSPLNQIKGLTDLIKMSPSSNGSNAEYVELIGTSASRLTAMIGKILDVEAIESKALNLVLEDVNIAAAVRLVAGQLSVLAEQKEIQIDFSAAENIFVRADRSYLDQVIENLISNAIKFSPSGKIIFISITSQKNEALLEVRDQGPGLTEDDKQKLFKKYQRLSAAPTGNESSTGLGLSIVKKFVDAMQGEIWCESEYGAGASFFVRLRQANQVVT